MTKSTETTPTDKTGPVPESAEAPDNTAYRQKIVSSLDGYRRDISDACAKLERAAAQMRSAIMLAKDAGGRSGDYSTVYVELYRGDAYLAAAMKPLSEMVGELKNYKLPEAFEADNIKTLTMADGSRITISNVVRASVASGKKDEAYAYLRSNDLGDLITETLNASTLTAYAKTLIEQNRQLPEDLFNVAIMQQVSLTGSKAKP